MNRFILWGATALIALVASFSALAADTPALLRIGFQKSAVNLVILKRLPSPTGPLPAALVVEQQRVIDAFLQLGLIPRAVNVADIVWHPEKELP